MQQIILFIYLSGGIHIYMRACVRAYMCMCMCARVYYDICFYSFSFFFARLGAFIS